MRRSVSRLAAMLLVGIVWVAAAGAAEALGWRMPGLARDVAIGGTGAANNDLVWMIEKATPAGKRGGVVCQWQPETSKWIRHTNILGESVTVSQDGYAWVADSAGKVWRYSPHTEDWEEVILSGHYPGDIGIGQVGGVYFLFFIDRKDHRVYQWIGGSAFWNLEFPGSAFNDPVRVDVDQFDRPWVVTNSGRVYFYNTGEDSGWKLYSANYFAKDIGADLNGWEVWVAPYLIPNRGLAALWYTDQPSLEANPIPPFSWWRGPYFNAHRIDYSEGEIIVAKQNGEIWWVPLP